MPALEPASSAGEWMGATVEVWREPVTVADVLMEEATEAEVEEATEELEAEAEA